MIKIIKKKLVASEKPYLKDFFAFNRQRVVGLTPTQNRIGGDAAPTADGRNST